MEEQVQVNLIIRYLTQEATLDEIEQLNQWKVQHPSHQQLFDEYQQCWNQKLSLEKFSSVAKGLGKLNQRIDVLDKEKRTVSLSWYKIAASVALVLGVSISAYFLFDGFNQVKDQVYLERTSTSPQKLTFQLPDGTIVKLNSNASLKYPEEFGENTREVFLTGEAYFEVAKDSIRPFLVNSGELVTKVLGTKFNVKEANDQIEVTVASGKVSVKRENTQQLLLPNEKVIFDLSTKNLQKHSTNLEVELAWLENTLIFKDTRMEDASKVLEQWYGVTISFTNQDIKNCLITGKYKNPPLSKILNAISFSTGIEYTRTGNTISLNGNGCNKLY